MNQLKSTIGLLACGAVLLALAGCGGDAPAPEPLAVEAVPQTIAESFAGAPGEAKKLSEGVTEAFQGGDTVGAWSMLNQLNERPDISAEQRDAATRAQVALMQKIQAEAAAGNAKASEFMNAYRSSR